ncbi:subtilisin-like serine protease [Acrasis kona]|uniref:Subtilisin-like serine protease n=1 Tax=Acrasis kona TaxID=1008807 RepID=A0AAW2ZCQ6_9EUKA
MRAALCVFLLISVVVCTDNYIIKTITNDVMGAISFLNKNNHNAIVKGNFNFGLKSGLFGFVAQMDEVAADELSRQDGVVEVIRSEKIHVFADDFVPNKISLASRSVQNNATYNLDLLDGVLDGKYNYVSGGAGVNVYVMDSGIKDSHPEFEGRVKWGYSAAGKTDDFGHGTHVAGIIGSKTYGVAKNVTLIAVRVSDTKGSIETANLYLAFDYVLNEHKKSGKHGVINISFGGIGDSFKTFAKIFETLVDSGVAIAASAGNDFKDACLHGPGGNMKGLLSVSSVGGSLKMAYDSNYGKCVNILSPGEAILSTCISPPACYHRGTSMATPHVTGVLAQALSLRKFNSTQEVYDFVLKSAQVGIIKGDLQNTPNVFLNTPK